MKIIYIAIYENKNEYAKILLGAFDSQSKAWEECEKDAVRRVKTMSCYKVESVQYRG